MGTKSATLRVTTNRPCLRAVAVVAKRGTELAPASGDLQIERQNPNAVESQHAVEPRRERRSENPGLLYAAVRYRIRSHHRDDAHEKIGRPLPFDLCCQACIAAAYGAPTKRLYRSEFQVRPDDASYSDVFDGRTRRHTYRFFSVALAVVRRTAV